MFHKPVGKEHESMYNAWWNKNIKPIWGYVKKTFYDQESNIIKTSDKRLILQIV